MAAGQTDAYADVDDAEHPPARGNDVDRATTAMQSHCYPPSGSNRKELRMKAVVAMRLLGGTALATLAALFSAGLAHADEDGYLNQLSRHGYQVVAPAREYLLGSGHAMCNDLQAGQTPEDVAKHWTYPNASYQNLLDMANAAQANLCHSSGGR
jgi:hypothetical protein